ncbi:MAG: uroporphyrinogen decarboxylase family protein [Verrucomicrobiota bacterium]|nr:uroporphyrinogen decarboxylase family protein [Verrucomicrobiota bacterium]
MKLSDQIIASKNRIAIPVATYPGMELTGARVIDIVTNADQQVAAQIALRKECHAEFLLSAMDLSLEAEAFGAEVRMSDDEIPTVIGRLISTKEQAESLKIPKPGDKRTQVAIDVVKKLTQVGDGGKVLAGMIGPFSLAGRLFGVSEALVQTAEDPEVIEIILQKVTDFLIEYGRALKDAGAYGMVVAEPAAGLLSPRALGKYSSSYVKQIASALEDKDFSIILHNCAAKVMHLPFALESGVKVHHFGAPMDIVDALSKVPADTVLCGNLDPTASFCQLSREQLIEKTKGLLDATAQYPNFVISSGCDVPPGTPFNNMRAFFNTVEEFNTARA